MYSNLYSVYQIILICVLSCIFRCYRFTDNYKKEEDKQNEVYNESGLLGFSCLFVRMF